eukprot:4403908-Pleurochrysis_carterae.AAC.3
MSAPEGSCDTHRYECFSNRSADDKGSGQLAGDWRCSLCVAEHAREDRRHAHPQQHSRKPQDGGRKRRHFEERCRRQHQSKVHRQHRAWGDEQRDWDGNEPTSSESAPEH